MKRWLLPVVLALMLPSCAWVKLTPEGEQVRVLEADDVTACRELGTTTSLLKADIAGIDRKREKVRQELEMLARNAAVDMGGDSVVPVTEPQDGRQVFAVYRCQEP